MKLVINVIATAVLLLHMQPITRLADLAAASTVDSHRLQLQVLVESAAALLILLIATVLSVFKPRGRTPFRSNTRRADLR